MGSSRPSVMGIGRFELHRPCLTIAWLAAAALALGACNDTTPLGTDDGVLEVEITTVASTVEVGATLQLQAVVSPSSASQGVTWSSDQPDLASVSGTGLVEAFAPGEVTIRATSVADPSKSDVLLLAVTGCPAPRMITSGTISSDQTWENWIEDTSCFDYIVDAQVNNQGSLLTIEPGTVIGVETDHSIVVRGDGGLLAAGTEEDPIVITSVTPGRGQWNGLFIGGTEHPQNRLEHLTIENAGVGNWSGSITRANLMLNGAHTTLRNVTSRNSAAFGISMMSGAQLRDHGANVLTGNELGPVHLAASMVHFLDAESDLGGNDVDLVSVVPTAIEAEVTWHPHGDGYLILKRSANHAFDVNGAEAHLTLADGVTIVFEEDMGMTVSSGGTLTVDASSDDPVVLTGAEQIPGFWWGLRLFTGGNLLNEVVIEYAGSSSHSGSIERANLFMSEDADAEVINSQLLNGAGYGLHARNGASLRFLNNTVSGNQSGPAHVPSTLIEEQWRFNDFTGNGRDAIMVATQSIRITQPAVWPDLAMPYVVFAVSGGGINVDGVSFTVDPGVEIRFGEDMGLSVNGGELSLSGTMDNPILLTSEGGQWQGVRVHKSTAMLAYTTLTGPGSKAWGLMSQAGAVTVSTNDGVVSQVQLGEEVSQSGATYGLVFGYGETLGLGGCDKLGAIFVHTGDTIEEHCP